MRILVCGSRDWDDEDAIWSVLKGVTALEDASSDSPLTIIEGGAKGADHIAAEFAKYAGHGVIHEQYPADWATHHKAAGPVRNKRMLVEGKPDVIWAFTNKPLSESKGTANMVAQARLAGLPTYVVERIN